MSNKSVDSEEHHENNPQHRSNLQQQYNFSNTTITAEKIVMGYGNNMDEAAFPFEMNKEEFERAKNKPSVSRETAESAVSTTSSPTPQHTWKSLRNYVIDRPYAAFNARYAGHDIKCTGNGYIRKLQLVWCCTCTDIQSGVSRKCDRYASQRGACEHTLAELVRTMHEKNVYPMPSDADSMTTRC